MSKMNILERDYVPKNEIWFVSNSGKHDDTVDAFRYAMLTNIGPEPKWYNKLWAWFQAVFVGRMVRLIRKLARTPYDRQSNRRAD